VHVTCATAALRTRDGKRTVSDSRGGPLLIFFPCLFTPSINYRYDKNNLISFSSRPYFRSHFYTGIRRGLQLYSSARAECPVQNNTAKIVIIIIIGQGFLDVHVTGICADTRGNYSRFACSIVISRLCQAARQHYRRPIVIIISAPLMPRTYLCLHGVYQGLGRVKVLDEWRSSGLCTGRPAFGEVVANKKKSIRL